MISVSTLGGRKKEKRKSSMIVTFFFSFSHCSAGEDSQCSRKCPTPNVSEVSAVPGTV